MGSWWLLAVLWHWFWLAPMASWVPRLCSDMGSLWMGIFNTAGSHTFSHTQVQPTDSYVAEKCKHRWYITRIFLHLYTCYLVFFPVFLIIWQICITIIVNGSSLPFQTHTQTTLLRYVFCNQLNDSNQPFALMWLSLSAITILTSVKSWWKLYLRLPSLIKYNFDFIF